MRNYYELCYFRSFKCCIMAIFQSSHSPLVFSLLPSSKTTAFGSCDSKSWFQSNEPKIHAKVIKCPSRSFSKFPVAIRINSRFKTLFANQLWTLLGTLVFGNEIQSCSLAALKDLSIMAVNWICKTHHCEIFSFYGWSRLLCQRPNVFSTS